MVDVLPKVQRVDVWPADRPSRLDQMNLQYCTGNDSGGHSKSWSASARQNKNLIGLLCSVAQEMCVLVCVCMLLYFEF